MGIYQRYATAFLILAFSLPAFSAYRTNYNPTSQEVIKGGAPPVAPYQTPSGHVAYYGEEALYEIQAGNKFTAGDAPAPTIRQVKPSSVGSISTPYGESAYYNGASNPVSKIKVKPVSLVPKLNIAAKAKNFIKTTPGQIALSAAISGAVAAVGWVMSDDNTKVRKKTSEGEVQPVSTYGWSFSSSGCRGPYVSAQAFMTCYQSYLDAVDGRFNYPYTVSPGADGRLNINWEQRFKSNNGYIGSGTFYAFKVGNCAAPLVLTALYTCVDPSKATFADVTDSDFSALDAWATGTATEAMLRGMLTDACNGSLSPATCFSEAEDRSRRIIAGPTSAPGPSTTTTGTYTKPDGSTGTTSTTTNTNYTFNYGPTYFDTTTATTTETKKDGAITETTSATDSTAPTDPAPNTDEEPDTSGTYADTDFPSVKPFYEQKYPDGLSGVWNHANNQIQSSQFITFLASFVPSFSGSCPRFGLSFNIASWANFGTQEFSDLCYVFAFIKVILEVSALFLCRAIIFGG